MPLLLDSAVRSLLLGLFVWALLKLVRVHDTGTETIIWTVVLMVALSMPLLNHYLPGLVVVVPHLSAAPQQSGLALQMSGTQDSSVTLLWLFRHGQTCLVGAYALGLAARLSRLAIGLFLSLRLYQRAVPVKADWAQGRQIYSNAALKSPASLARVILLPADYPDWSVTKRDAVLAHEEAHIARGDFFVGLAATIHGALFWFSPFAWWLQSKLAELAETASDEAAIRRLNDPITYAEILVEVARRAQPSPPIIAMAKGPLIQRRVDRILSEAPGQPLSPPLQACALGALTLMALTFASVTTAGDSRPPNAVSSRSSPASGQSATFSASRPRVRSPGATRRHLRPAPSPLLSAAADAPQRRNDTVSYNPRALLDPVYVPARSYLPASSIVHAGKTFYIRSTERPVTDVSAADAMYRPAR